MINFAEKYRILLHRIFQLRFGCELSLGTTTYAYTPVEAPAQPPSRAWPDEAPLLAQVYRAPHVAGCAKHCDIVVRADLRDVRDGGGIGDLAVKALVERYDAVKFCIFQRNWSNFRGLVLFCINADFCNQILIFSIFQDLQNSHTFAPLLIQNIRKNSSNFFNFCSNF